MNRYIANTLGASLIIATCLVCVLLVRLGNAVLAFDAPKHSQELTAAITDTRRTLAEISGLANEIRRIGRSNEASTMALARQSVETSNRVNELLSRTNETIGGINRLTGALQQSSESISRDTHDALVSTQNTMAELQVTLRQSTETLKASQGLIENPQLADSFNQLDGTIRNLQVTTARIDHITATYEKMLTTPAGKIKTAAKFILHLFTFNIR